MNRRRLQKRIPSLAHADDSVIDMEVMNDVEPRTLSELKAKASEPQFKIDLPHIGDENIFGSSKEQRNHQCDPPILKYQIV